MSQALADIQERIAHHLDFLVHVQQKFDYQPVLGGVVTVASTGGTAIGALAHHDEQIGAMEITAIGDNQIRLLLRDQRHRLLRVTQQYVTGNFEHEAMERMYRLLLGLQTATELVTELRLQDIKAIVGLRFNLSGFDDYEGFELQSLGGTGGEARLANGLTSGLVTSMTINTLSQSSKQTS